MNKSYQSIRLPKMSFFSLFVILSFLTFWSLFNLNYLRFFSRISIAGTLELISNYFFPPNFDPKVRKSIEFALLETLQIALIGTYFGIFCSLPLSILSANSLTPKFVHIPFRFILSAIRTVPSLIWALLFVITFGLGPHSGILAITVYTTGFLGKLQYETFEGLPSDSIQALKALGAGKIQIVRYVVLPESGNSLISQIIFMFEYNVRASSIIGFVGAGGIGFLLQLYIAYFHFSAMLTALIYLLVVVVIIDFLGSKLRASFQDPSYDVLNI